MKTFTTIRPWCYHYRHFAVPGQPRLASQWQHGIETISGYGPMEIASHVRAFAITSLRNS